jgi:hypothetical protein
LFEGAVGREGQPLVVHVQVIVGFGLGHGSCSWRLRSICQFKARFRPRAHRR